MRGKLCHIVVHASHSNVKCSSFSLSRIGYSVHMGFPLANHLETPFLVSRSWLHCWGGRFHYFLVVGWWLGGQIPPYLNGNFYPNSKTGYNLLKNMLWWDIIIQLFHFYLCFWSVTLSWWRQRGAQSSTHVQTFVYWYYTKWKFSL